jgi:hypothetical protein
LKAAESYFPIIGLNIALSQQMTKAMNSLDGGGLQGARRVSGKTG